jgi:hypothetical protein
VAAGGAGRGSGLAAVALICGVGAAGGGAAVCVDQGVLPNPLDRPSHEQVEPVPVAAPAVVADPAEPVPRSREVPPEPEPAPTPAQVRAREFDPQPSSGSSEFGGPAAPAGGSGSGGGSGGSQFGFEK